MKLEFQLRDQLIKKTEFLNQYRKQVEDFSEQIELLEVSRENAAIEADQIEAEIAELLKDIARPSIVVVDSKVYELVDEARRPDDSHVSICDGGLHVYLPSENRVTRFRPIATSTVVT